ncbi:MAG: N2,N2-dimethylguanosine tRNA methyltransferase [Cyanobacteriota bacterium]|nr:N2,N2-dimethylguanosine tRNA methyltransferase [Cyanobacteriota bacterium]
MERNGNSQNFEFGQLQDEGPVRFHTGDGFFNPASRPSRDLGVLLACILARRRPLRVLDLMAGCGLRSLRYRLEAQASFLVANDADPSRLPLLKRNLGAQEGKCVLRISAETAQRLLASCLVRGERFDLVDLDAFGSPNAILPLALEALAFDGALYMASTDGRGPTGHDRTAGLRRFGASVRCHPASWELALRLQLGVIARMAWCQGRGIEPLLSFSDGRSFRTAVRVQRHPLPGEELLLGLWATCPRCGDQEVQSMGHLKSWGSCQCPSQGWGVSGPLWIGHLQHTPTLNAMAEEAERLPSSLSRTGALLLGRLQRDPGATARCWPSALIASHLKISQVTLRRLVGGLREKGYGASASGVMAGQLRSDAPWGTILALAEELAGGTAK